MIDLSPHKLALDDRINMATRLIDETHPGSTTSATAVPGPISREVKGFIFVMLFGAYENLIYTVTSTTASGRYEMRRGGVTVPVALRMLVAYDCCYGDGAAGLGHGWAGACGAGGVAGGVR